ncbi:nitronate monooxygenase [Poseidonocella pacifica]|nr:nitronate monooxygenase [Poseidonocella pacifica]
MGPDTRLRDLFSIDHPIIQAPMADAGGLDMALSVSAAGGLGSLACAVF